MLIRYAQGLNRKRRKFPFQISYEGSWAEFYCVYYAVERRCPWPLALHTPGWSFKSSRPRDDVVGWLDDLIRPPDRRQCQRSAEARKFGSPRSRTKLTIDRTIRRSCSAARFGHDVNRMQPERTIQNQHDGAQPAKNGRFLRPARVILSLS